MVIIVFYLMKKKPNEKVFKKNCNDYELAFDSSFVSKKISCARKTEKMDFDRN